MDKIAKALQTVIAESRKRHVTLTDLKFIEMLMRGVLVAIEMTIKECEDKPGHARINTNIKQVVRHRGGGDCGK